MAEVLRNHYRRQSVDGSASSGLSIGSVSSHGKSKSSSTPDTDHLGYDQTQSGEKSPRPGTFRRGSITGRRSNEDLADMGVHARRSRRRQSIGGVNPTAPAVEKERASGTHVSPKRRQRRGSCR